MLSIYCLLAVLLKFICHFSVILVSLIKLFHEFTVAWLVQSRAPKYDPTICVQSSKLPLSMVQAIAYKY